MSIVRGLELDEKDITVTFSSGEEFQNGLGHFLYGKYKGEPVIIWEYYPLSQEEFNAAIPGLGAVQQHMKENHIPIKGVVKNKQWIVCEKMGYRLNELFGEAKTSGKPIDELLCFRILHEISSAESARQHIPDQNASIEKELKDTNFFLVMDHRKKLADAKTLADKFLTMSPIVLMGLTSAQFLGRAGHVRNAYTNPPGYVDESEANTAEKRAKFNNSRDETAV